MNKATASQKPLDTTQKVSSRYSVEFFHIYTDETIGSGHKTSIDYLKAASPAWDVDFDPIIMIDNYNPKEHILTSKDVMEYLSSQGMTPRYWAYEADMAQNAELLLSSLPEGKLKRSYLRYIDARGKYPCSLLTASWYLTRLGVLDHSVIRATNPEDTYETATKLINILPIGYKEVEKRAAKIITESPYAAQVHNIQDLFFPDMSHRKIELF